MGMALFALSCFGLLLFLWLSFGGSVPLKPKGYRFQVGFPEAAQLGLQADVRMSGVSVGKVVAKELDPAGNRTLATIQLERKFAPVRSDARAILRQKTLLGETYVELTPGSPRAAAVREGGRLRDGRVAEAVQLDEIFQALDPQTRKAFQVWQQSLAKAVRGRGQDLNDALGNLPGFVRDANDILTVLDRQGAAVRRLVRNTGVTFGALTQDERQLHNLIVNSAQVFDATASQNQALAESFRIFPTFLDESKATMRRLKSFALDTDPLIRDLRQPTRDLGPTLRSVRLLAPDLRFFFRQLDPLIRVSRRGLPALREVLEGATG
jgi:virulence factor Mce-like protein